MKPPNQSSVGTEVKVWCERCCIRIAPNEERVESKGKCYHLRCVPKPSRSSTRKPSAKA